MLHVSMKEGVNNMKRNRKEINAKLKQLGAPLGLSETDAMQAKRTIKNVATMAVFAGIFFIFGSVLMPGGPAGLYYTGASVKDFQILFGGFL